MPTIAYLGPKNTNTHVAALKRFGRWSKYVHAPTVDDVFHAVERQQADYGVVPVENSLEGTVTHTLDRFIDFLHSPVTIHGEMEQPIRHSLILHRGTKVSDVEGVYSHPQALAQCRQWLDQHVPHATKRETHSTAEAVELIRDVRHARLAAIARAELARGGHTLHAVEIPEPRENRTRFLVLGLHEPARGRRNKTSILFALKDAPGALHDALVPFKRNRINLTKIESRPSKRKAWEYLFFIDVEGHTSEPRMKRALKAVACSTSLLRILGSYPVATR